MKSLRITSLLTLLATSLTAFAKDELNIARPDVHPYVDPAGNREHHANADATANEARVYEFYQRQADYYMSSVDRPEILPAFPGLDAGLHGHWGKHSQNDYKDGRWNQIDMGRIWGHSIRVGKFAVGKGIAVNLGEAGKLSVCFDPETLSYPFLWQDGFVKFDPYRWGSSRNATPDGKIWFKTSRKLAAWSRDRKPITFQYHGYFRNNGRTTFFYEIEGRPILDHPSVKGTGEDMGFVRTLTFSKGFTGGELSLGALPPELKIAVSVGELKTVDGITSIVIPELKGTVTMGLAIGHSKTAVTEAAAAAGEKDLSPLVKAGPLQWPNTLTTQGSIAKDESLPYVIDTIAIPADTGFQSIMQITSVGFFPDGTALIATLAGEIWQVSGLTEKLEEVTWKRFAAGLYQPIGIHIDDDGIFVMERGQITRLHDTNHDGEADFYESYANDFEGRNQSHTHSFGLTRGDDGSFYFVNWKDIYRTAPNRKTNYYAFGVRNCMGVGNGADGSLLVGPQEGTQTPASMVIDVHEGEFYGHPGDNPGAEISPPLCFIPRGVDNSTGGFVFANDDRWGPLQGRTIGLSYGYSTHYLVLRDSSTSRHQGAIVPLEGDFQSGIMRGAFGPHDGQLYVTGIDGWGDYSVSDGCFHRVRYTGKPLRKPIGFQVHSNGIRIDFSTPLDPAAATEVENFFVQQWNYEYANQYGSPEFSQRDPDSLGHDVLSIRSVHLLDSGTSLFIEIPEIETVMQMHIRMHLTGADGVPFKTDLFPTVLELGNAYSAPGLAEPIPGKASQITLRVKIPKDAGQLDTESGELIEGERTLTLECSGALQFGSKLLEAKAGEPLKLVFTNPDIMPHNVVFVTAGNLKKIGDLSFSMLNDPKAADKHYTPDAPEVIAGTFLVQPGGSHTLHFFAPKEPGDHHFVCTFPGHWMTMNGIFRVK